jgi:hypothetical protein
MTIEAMKQALEALEKHGCAWLSHEKQYAKAITSLRQAIAVYESAPPECQTEAEKTAFAFGWWKAMEAQQAEKQEPKCVVIVEVFEKDWRLEYMSLPVGRHKLYAQQYLYTHPQPKREWVGLTDDEMNEAMDYWSDGSRSAYGGAHAADGEYVSMISTWQYIEEKLKEKNT